MEAGQSIAPSETDVKRVEFIPLERLKLEDTLGPAVDLEEVDLEQELIGTTRELARAKIDVLAEAFSKEYSQGFGLLIKHQLQPVMPATEEEQMAQMLALELQRAKLDAVWATLQHTVRSWVATGLLLGVVGFNFGVRPDAAFFMSGCYSAIAGPIWALVENKRG